MIDRHDLTYTDGYYVGKEEGYKKGYDEGWQDAMNDFEPRIARYWAELATLNARIDYLERFTGADNNTSGDVA